MPRARRPTHRVRSLGLGGNSQQLIDGASICLAVPADLNEDDDVDVDDFTIFAGCTMGLGVAYPGGCEYAELDGDVDVDLWDFASFQGAHNGP